MRTKSGAESMAVSMVASKLVGKFWAKAPTTNGSIPTRAKTEVDLTTSTISASRSSALQARTKFTANAGISGTGTDLNSSKEVFFPDDGRPSTLRIHATMAIAKEKVRMALAILTFVFFDVCLVF